jgi:hypothetical protein
MAQERHPPSKAFKFELFFKMQKNKDGIVTCLFCLLCVLFPMLGLACRN